MSVVSSEMSASCPLELLKAHAVISRSWLRYPKEPTVAARLASQTPIKQSGDPHEMIRWYGRDAHRDFDVCADDHCQRYQGITKAFSAGASSAVAATADEVLFYDGVVCDARFSKSCGAITEIYSTAWEDWDIPYLVSVYDGETQPASYDAEGLIRAEPPAWCNTKDTRLLARILPGFDQETVDFYRWRVEYSAEELGELIAARLGVDLGPIREMEALARGPSTRIHRLKIVGEKDYVIIGKELEIRRALSRSHLYSSAFVVDREAGRFVLHGAGWGHGVGLCQIGAAVMADQGKNYREILGHYYRGSMIGTLRSAI
jgi:SpoIID/LytB domain protein